MAVSVEPVVDQIARAAPFFGSQSVKEADYLADDTVAWIFNLLTSIVTSGGGQMVGEDAAEAETFLAACQNAPGWSDALLRLAGVAFTRFAVIEVVYEMRDGLLLPASFWPVESSEAQISIDERRQIAEIRLHGSDVLPLERAIVLRNSPTFGRPLGCSFYDALHRLIRDKRSIDAAIARGVERAAVPSIGGKVPRGTPPAQRQELLDQISKLQTAGAFVVDDGVQIEWLESSFSAMPAALEISRDYSRRIGRAVLGAILAFDESQYGTRAQSSVHKAILKPTIKTHQHQIEAALDAQLFQRLIAWNFGRPLDARFALLEPDIEELSALAAIVRDLLEGGVLDPIDDRNAIRSRFGFEPVENEPDQPG